MKTLLVGLILLGLAGSALAIDQPALDNRVRNLTARLDELQAKPDKHIPADVLSRAQGIILLDRTKAGFLFAFEGGGGLALMKDPRTHQWSAPVFVSANEASLGFQVGGEETFYAIILMTTNATRLLIEPAFELGGEARGTAGDLAGGAQSKASALAGDVVVYTDRAGLFGGADVKAGAIKPDDQANVIYYGKSVTMTQILFGHEMMPSETAKVLAQKLNDYSVTAEVSAQAKN